MPRTPRTAVAAGEPPGEPATTATTSTTAGASVTSWRYVGGVERCYSNVPVTVVHGDVIAWTALDEHGEPVPPAPDGLWEPAPGVEPTRAPDNHPPNAPAVVVPDSQADVAASEADAGEVSGDA